MWQEEPHRWALIELWTTGSLRRRKAQVRAWDELDGLPWTHRTPRRGEIEIDEGHRGSVEALLDRSCPDWRALLDELEQHDLPADLHGWKRLQEIRRGADLPSSLPDRINLRTATAAVGAHSKSRLGDRLREALGPVEVTRDSLIRLRPNPGLLVEGAGATWRAEQIAEVLGELTLTERAIRDGTTLAGTLPGALLLAENLGFYLDVPVPPGWMVGHVPGWNTSTVRLLLDALPSVPVVHFGDLDPNGVRIVAHLQRIRPDLIWAVPPFWEEQIATRGRSTEWPPDLDLEDAPPLVRRLASAGVWLEQEALALEPRLPSYLERLVHRREG